MLEIISNFIWGAISLVAAVILFMTGDILWGFISLVLAVYFLYFRGYQGLQEKKRNKNT